MQTPTPFPSSGTLSLPPLRSHPFFISSLACSLFSAQYYDWPAENNAYLMDGAGNSVQYMFGPDMLFSPVVTPATGGDATQHLANKVSLAVSLCTWPSGITCKGV